MEENSGRFLRGRNVNFYRVFIFELLNISVQFLSKTSHAFLHYFPLSAINGQYQIFALTLNSSRAVIGLVGSFRDFCDSFPRTLNADWPPTV